MNQLKRLAEIEERFDASRRLTRDHAHDVSPDPLIGCRACAKADRAQWELREHARADLAYLLRIVRMVAEAACESYVARPACHLGAGASADELCWPCRVRRELGRG